MAKANGNKSNGANLGFEATLRKAADALRANMDAAEYKHVVLGLIFLKYFSDAFEEQHAKLQADRKSGADPEDPDEYRALNIFWVPKEARWSHLKANAKQSEIGKIIDKAMLAIERDNPSLEGVLPKDYARSQLDKQRLGQLIDLIGNIGLGDKENRSKDILVRVSEYFLAQFASAEGKKAGQFFTPRCVVRLLVEMLAPYKGRVYRRYCDISAMPRDSLCQLTEEHENNMVADQVAGLKLNLTRDSMRKADLPLKGKGEETKTFKYYLTMWQATFPFRQLYFVDCAPPCGKTWSPPLKQFSRTDGITAPSFLFSPSGNAFSLLTPSKNDPLTQLLTMRSNMNRSTRLGCQVSYVHNASSILTALPGNGPSNLPLPPIHQSSLLAFPAFPLRTYSFTRIPASFRPPTTSIPEQRTNTVLLIDPAHPFARLPHSPQSKAWQPFPANIDRICTCVEPARPHRPPGPLNYPSTQIATLNTTLHPMLEPLQRHTFKPFSRPPATYTTGENP